MVSALRFREDGCAASFFANLVGSMKARTPSRIGARRVASLQFQHFESAYHTFTKGQRYLQKGALDLDILKKAFRGFDNLERVTFDRSNDNIGFSQLKSCFGEYSPGVALLTFDDLYTLPTLVRALSEARTKLTELYLGCRYDISEPRFNSQEHWRQSRLTTNALIAAFNHPGSSAHASQVMSEIQIMKIGETDVEDNRYDLLSMAATIKHMTSLSPKLRSIEIGKIRPLNYLSNMQRLSIEDLFELQSVFHLQHIKLTHLEIPDCRSIVAFLRHHACTLVHVKLAFVHLMVERYIYFLVNAKELEVNN